MCAVSSSAGSSPPAFLRAKDGVAESLRETVDGLPRAIQLEAQPTFVERALTPIVRRDPAPDAAVEQCHGRRSREAVNTDVHGQLRCARLGRLPAVRRRNEEAPAMRRPRYRRACDANYAAVVAELSRRVG